MKNFFKKLALVLALALVVTVVAPAAASNSEAASVALTAKSAKVSIGKSYDFNLKNKVKGSTYKWTSSNKNVATVNAKNGLTKGVAVGTATISCKITMPNKTTKTVKGTITVCPDATAVAISNPTEKVDLGSSYDFNRTMTPSNSVNKTYWIVKDASGKEVANTKTGVGAAIMNSKGVFTPDTIGTFTITAECWRSKTASVKRAESAAVTVKVALPRLETIAIQEATYDDDTKGQKLTVLANGKVIDVNTLVQSGYTVEFTASAISGSDPEKLFKSPLSTNAAKSNSNVLADTIPMGSYGVKVVASKLGEYAESSVTTIKVENLNAAVSSVLGAKYKSGTSVTELTKGQLVLGEDAVLTGLTYMLNGSKKTLSDLTKVKLTSSNTDVLAIAGTSLKPLKAGTASVTAEYNKQTFVTNFTVNAEGRKAQSIVAKTATKTLLKADTNKTITFVVYDQYGEALNAVAKAADEKTAAGSVDCLTVTANSKLTQPTITIAAASTGKGEYVITLPGVAAAAKDKDEIDVTVTINRYNANSLTGSQFSYVASATTKVKITTNDDLGDYKPYVVKTTADGYSSTQTLTLGGNSKVKIAVEKINTDKESLGDVTPFTAASTNTGVVTVEASDTNGIVEATAVGAGEADITVTVGAETRKLHLTVSGAQLKLNGIEQKPITLNHKGAGAGLADLFYGTEVESGKDKILDKSKLTLSATVTNDVRLKSATYATPGNTDDGKWLIYVDNDGSGQYSAGDTKLGTLEAFAYLNGKQSIVTGLGSTEIKVDSGAVKGDEAVCFTNVQTGTKPSDSIKLYVNIKIG